MDLANREDGQRFFSSTVWKYLKEQPTGTDIYYILLLYIYLLLVFGLCWITILRILILSISVNPM